MDVGSNIRKYRKSRNITITKLAEMAGTQREYLSSIENGKKTPSFTMIDKIASSLGVQVNDLITETSESPSPELEKLLFNARSLHPTMLQSLNSMLESLNNNYRFVEKNINGIESSYVVDLNIKPNGLTEEDELEAQRLVHRLNEIKKQSEEK